MSSTGINNEAEKQNSYLRGCDDTEKKFQGAMLPVKNCLISYLGQYIERAGIDIERDFFEILPVILDAVLYSDGDIRKITFNLYGKLPENVYSLFCEKSVRESRIIEEANARVKSMQKEIENMEGEISKRNYFLSQKLANRDKEYLALEKECVELQRTIAELTRGTKKKTRLIQQLQDRLDGVNNSGQ